VAANAAKFVPASWVTEGMTVFAPWELFCTGEDRKRARAKGTGVRCKVVCAAGDHARVENVERGVDRWFHIRDLYVPRARGGADACLS